MRSGSGCGGRGRSRDGGRLRLDVGRRRIRRGCHRRDVRLGARHGSRRRPPDAAQLSSFDVVVTIALGTILGSTAVSPSVSYSDGLAAVLTLLVLQVAVGAVRRWSPRLRRLLDFRPIDVVNRDRVPLPEGLLGPQLAVEDLHSQLRLRGIFEPPRATRVVVGANRGYLRHHRLRMPRRSPFDPRGPRVPPRAPPAWGSRGRSPCELRNRRRAVVRRGCEARPRGRPGGGPRFLARRASGGYDDVMLMVEGEVGFVRWSAPVVLSANDGAECYLVRGGLIVAETFHRLANE